MDQDAATRLYTRTRQLVEAAVYQAVVNFNPSRPENTERFTKVQVAAGVLGETFQQIEKSNLGPEQAVQVLALQTSSIEAIREVFDPESHGKLIDQLSELQTELAASQQSARQR